MNRGIVRYVGALTALLLAAAGCNGDTDRTAAAAAESAVVSFLDASNSSDADRILAHYHQGPELVQVACTEVRQGYDRVERIIRTWVQDRSEASLEYEIIRSEAIGADAAVVAAQGFNERGEPLFWTYVLRRDRDGDWRIIQEHQSWPGCREPRRRFHG